MAYVVALVLLSAVATCLAQENTSVCPVDQPCLAKVGLAYSRAEGKEDFIPFSTEVLKCVGDFSNPLRALKILSPKQNAVDLPAIVAEFYNVTGFRVDITYAELDEVATIVLDVATGDAVFDAWILDPITLVDLSQKGQLEKLDSYIAGDSAIDWLGVQRFFREVSSVYNGSVLGIPLAGKISTLFYRADVFAAAGLQPPATWNEYMAIAAMLNGSDFSGDGKPDYSLCWQISNNCLEDYTVFGQILASMTQTQGTQSGWLFDPDTMAPLIDNEAGLRALTLMAQSVGYTWPSDGSCNLYHTRFLSGECLMTVKWDEQFKALELLDLFTPGMEVNPWKGGTIGYTQLPGSAQVLDRPSGTLVNCTGSLCPYATNATNSLTGVTRLINRAPHSGLVGISGLVNSLSPPAYKQAAYDFFSLISLDTQLVIKPSPVGPFRTSSLSTSNAGLALWGQFGYNTTDVRNFLTNMASSLANPNFALDLRITCGFQFRIAIKQAVASICGGINPAVAKATLTQNFQRIAAGINPQLLRDGYRRALNLQPVPPPPSTFTPPMSLPPQAASDGLSLSNVVGIVVGCCLAVALLLMIALVLYRSRMTPRLSHLVTLMVTDIENSTSLWEMLPQEAMNKAVELHHALARALLRKHKGYESATEGDSFILAFHTPAQALAFAQAFQAGLLVQNWPPELLDCPAGQPVWAMRAAELAKRNVSHAESRITASQVLGIASAERLSHMPGSTMHHTRLLGFYVASWTQIEQQTPVHISSGGTNELVFRGLRVRVGIHSGLENQSDVSVNKTTGRLQYSGLPMRIAKAVTDCGHGGMVLLSQAAFKKLPVKSLTSFGQLLNMGDYAFHKDTDLPCTPIYQAVAQGMEHRLAFQAPLLRSVKQLQAGVLDAPLGNVTIVFANMVGVSTLLAWRRDLAEEAINIFQSHAVRLVGDTLDEGDGGQSGS